MPRWQFAPFFLSTAAFAAWHEVLVAIDGVTLAFDPPSITAVANDAIHFVVPDSKMMLVQAKSLGEPCTPLPGGFRSVPGLGKLDVTINDRLSGEAVLIEAHADDTILRLRRPILHERNGLHNQCCR
ncbi:hypothetical protein AURDEDRAFT_121647 [Auricularia subglabra TFB-10046 SS5]|nr:hypothetical protein AURDEDRAFT_121647 [Auricularia subglabra TFB-10046 SS5]